MAYRVANTRNGRGPDFGLGNQVLIAKAELTRRIDEGTTESAALDVMGRELGYSSKEPRKALKRALFGERMRARKAVQKPVPTPGVTIVRNGQKAA